jgi:hypothetical protein
LNTAPGFSALSPRNGFASAHPGQTSAI